MKQSEAFLLYNLWVTGDACCDVLGWKSLTLEHGSILKVILAPVSQIFGVAINQAWEIHLQCHSHRPEILISVQQSDKQPT